MHHRIFFEHYRICEDPPGSPQELGRSGAAIVYKAIDARSNNPVTIQLIPLASIDPATREQFEERASSAQQLDHVNIARVLQVGVESDFLVFVSELVEGETTDAWVVANGPMPADAVLRAGLEVVRALEAAAFFSLTHRALQPSNIMIVPGTAPDGGWPFVKLLNFGLASAESHATETPGAALAPAVAPQFASPEQLRNEPLDFRSEVYSLAATMCFLLTGAAPLANGSNGRLRRFPELRRLPRALRNLLSAMLSEKPEHRPQDPVALENEMRNCLTALERRQSIRQKLGIPMMAAIPKVTRGSSPAAQALRGAIAFAVLLLIAAGVTAAFFPGILHFNRSANEIGVPIGVPQAKPASVATQTSSADVPPRPSSTPNAAANNQSTDVAQHSPPTQNPPPPASSDTTAAPGTVASKQSSPAAQQSPSSSEVAAANQPQQPAPPAEGPDESATTGDRNRSVASNDSAPNELTEDNQSFTGSESTANSRSRTKSKTLPPTTSSRRSRAAKSEEEESTTRRPPPLHRGEVRARWVGQTPDGRPILRLPSGRIVIVAPRAPDEDDAPVRRRVISRDRQYDESPPSQPFNEPRD
jgi:serine/threonine protein kinase